MATSKNWIVTGCTSGLGREIAMEALRRGHRVAATARKPQQLAASFEKFGERAFLLELDVTRNDSIEQALAKARDRFGSLDVLVNAAGVGLLAALEEASEDQVRQIFETNFMGTAHTIRAVLPYMRAQRSGYIINVSSVGGFVTVPGFGYYHATKFALEGLSETLAQETRSFGIRVTIVVPGATRTNFDSSLVTAAEIESYQETVGKVRKLIRERNGSQAGDPAKCAIEIVNLTECEEPPLHLFLGSDTVDKLRSKLDALRSELSQWETVSRRVTFET
jgi:NAD(P)-dependent dehydrogenase (short-subunit alcohol dehydrogenase family)